MDSVPKAADCDGLQFEEMIHNIGLMYADLADEAGQLTVSGLVPIKMTDFGITPPSPKLPTGSIQTDPEVKISFDWVVAK